MDIEGVSISQANSLYSSPKDEIAAQKLALCLPLFSIRDPYHAEHAYDLMPDVAKRHVAAQENGPAKPISCS